MFKSTGLYCQGNSKVTLIKWIQNIYLAVTPPHTSHLPDPCIYFSSMDNHTKVVFKAEGTEGGNKYVLGVHTQSVCTARALKDVWKHELHSQAGRQGNARQRAKSGRCRGLALGKQKAPWSVYLSWMPCVESSSWGRKARSSWKVSRSQNPLFVWVKGPAEAGKSRQTVPSQEPPPWCQRREWGWVKQLQTQGGRGNKCFASSGRSGM